MPSYNRRDDWIDDDEYPDERDIAELGDEAAPDSDPLTIGYVGDRRQPFWTLRRLVVLAIVLLMIAALLLPELLTLLR